MTKTTADPGISREQVVTLLGTQIGNQLVLVLTALWMNGERDAAKASISFPEYPMPGLVELCRTQGQISPRSIRSSHPMANAQFPDCQIYIIPVILVDEVWSLVKKIRLAALKELAAQEHDNAS